MIIVEAVTRIAPESREAFLKEVRQTIAASLDEPGVVTYACSEDVREPGTFRWIEVWTDLDAFNAHAEAPHHLDYLRALADEAYVKRSAPASGVYYQAEPLDNEQREKLGFSPASMPGYVPA